MKHIGIVSITIVGAAACAKAIVAAHEQLFHSDNHPNFTLHALSFGQYKKYLIAGDYQAVTDMIVESVQVLERAGVDFVIMPSNTPHIVYKQVKARVNIPFLSLIEITADECLAKGFQNVAVLGTSITAQSGLYTNALQERGIVPLLPNSNLQAEMHLIIQQVLIPQKQNAQRIQGLIDQLRNIPSHAFILGCTELPEILNADILGKPVIDTTYLLAQKAVEYSNQM